MSNGSMMSLNSLRGSRTSGGRGVVRRHYCPSFPSVLLHFLLLVVPMVWLSCGMVDSVAAQGPGTYMVANLKQDLQALEGSVRVGQTRQEARADGWYMYTDDFRNLTWDRFECSIWFPGNQYAFSSGIECGGVSSTLHRPPEANWREQYTFLNPDRCTWFSTPTTLDTIGIEYVLQQTFAHPITFQAQARVNHCSGRVEWRVNLTSRLHTGDATQPGAVAAVGCGEKQEYETFNVTVREGRAEGTGFMIVFDKDGNYNFDGSYVDMLVYASCQDPCTSPFCMAEYERSCTQGLAPLYRLNECQPSGQASVVTFTCDSVNDTSRVMHIRNPLVVTIRNCTFHTLRFDGRWDPRTCITIDASAITTSLVFNLQPGYGGALTMTNSTTAGMTLASGNHTAIKFDGVVSSKRFRPHGTFLHSSLVLHRVTVEDVSYALYFRGTFTDSQLNVTESLLLTKTTSGPKGYECMAFYSIVLTRTAFVMSDTRCPGSQLRYGIALGFDRDHRCKMYDTTFLILRSLLPQKPWTYMTAARSNFRIENSTVGDVAAPSFFDATCNRLLSTGEVVNLTGVKANFPCGSTAVPPLPGPPLVGHGPSVSDEVTSLQEACVPPDAPHEHLTATRPASFSLSRSREATVSRASTKSVPLSTTHGVLRSMMSSRTVSTTTHEDSREDVPSNTTGTIAIPVVPRSVSATAELPRDPIKTPTVFHDEPTRTPPAPPPLPDADTLDDDDAVTVQVRQSSAASGAVVVLAGVLRPSTAASKAGSSQRLFGAAECKGSSVELTGEDGSWTFWASYVPLLGVGGRGQERAARAAGGTVLFMGAVSCALLLLQRRAARAMLKRGTAEQDTASSAGAGAMPGTTSGAKELPGADSVLCGLATSKQALLLVAVLYTLAQFYYGPNVMELAAFLVAHGENVTLMAAGAACGLLRYATLVPVAWYLVTRFDVASVPRQRTHAPAYGLYELAVYPWYECAQLERVDRLNVRGLLLEDVAASDALALVAGARGGTAAGCSGAVYVGLLVAVVHAAYVCVVRPFGSRVETVLVAATSMVQAALAAAVVLVRHEMATTGAAGYLAMAVNVLAVLQAVALTVEEFVRWRSRASQPGTRDHTASLGDDTLDAPLLVVPGGANDAERRRSLASSGGGDVESTRRQVAAKHQQDDAQQSSRSSNAAHHHQERRKPSPSKRRSPATARGEQPSSSSAVAPLNPLQR